MSLQIAQLPAEPSPSGAPSATVQLFLWFPVRAERAVLPYLEQQGVQWEALEGQPGLRLIMPESSVGPVVLGLSELMSLEEASATKALRLPAGQAPELADLARVTTLRQLTLVYVSRWLQGLMVEGDRLVCHFQPIVHAADPTRLFGHEALLRGVERSGQLVPPLRLLQGARETGLMESLERQAQVTALRGLVTHELATTLFVNIHPDSVAETDALWDTKRMIARLGIPREQVVFEIVEMDSIKDVERFRRAMRDYQQAGFRFALDDLGSGYSSLNLVHQLRPDFIKLDMALVRDVHVNATKALITQMVLELSRRLGMQTIAEGVEQPGELEWLRAHGVDYLQGYLIARPAAVPVTQLPAPGGEAARRVGQAS